MPRSRVVRSNRSRPNNAWAGFVMSDYTTVGAASKTLLGSFSLSNPNIDETVFRIIGALSISSDQAAAVENQIGAVGLIVVSDNAVAAGAASIPGPMTDIDHDGWFAHQTFSQRGLFATTSSPQAFSYPLTSKGRRVSHEGEKIAVMVENFHASHGLLIALQFRILSRVTGT